MSGKCHYCGYETVALDGSQNRKARPKPPPGYRLGYVRETRLGSFLICAACLVNKLPANVTA